MFITLPNPTFVHQNPSRLFRQPCCWSSSFQHRTGLH